MPHEDGSNQSANARRRDDSRQEEASQENARHEYSPHDERLSSGIEELHQILGGFPEGRLLLIEGSPGSGKTTLASQFLLASSKSNKQGLYITLSQSEDEVRFLKCNAVQVPMVRVGYVGQADRVLPFSDEPCAAAAHNP